MIRTSLRPLVRSVAALLALSIGALAPTALAEGGTGGGGPWGSPSGNTTGAPKGG